jgi:photosystem II stability/assembly factor-like uncharacterized protein
LIGDRQPVGYVAHDPADGALYAAGFGPDGAPAVGRSADLGENWIWSSEGLAHCTGRPPVKQVWSILPTSGALYAGVDPAGLFRSDDRGRSWRPVGTPLLDHPTATEWRGGKGGLCLHSIVHRPAEPNRFWVAMAGGGVMFTDNAGRTWEPRNPPIGDPGAPLGLRVQRLELSAGDEPILYQQNHLGVFRSFDGGNSWQDVTGDLPSRFGFPLALHPREPDTLYVIPHLHGPNRRYIAGERAAVWRGTDGGRRWERLTNGLPNGPELVEVLRQGLATDSLTPSGVYFGTTDGRLFGSADDGDTWSTLAADLPPIYSVTAAVV